MRTTFLIPARNEGRNIVATLEAARVQAHVIVVTNGCDSHDKTAEISRIYGAEVYEARSKGKHLALREAFSALKLGERFDTVALLDADTVPQHDFMAQAHKAMTDGVVCVTGTAVSDMPKHSFNPLLAIRACGYFRSQVITRNLHNVLGTVQVLVGSNSLFRADVFGVCLAQETDSVTEDYTYLLDIERLGLGRTVHSHWARAVTADPRGLRAYCKQVSRWSLGNYQSNLSRRVGLKPRKLDLSFWWTWLEQVLWITSPIFTALVLMHVGISFLFLIGMAAGSSIGSIGAAIMWRRWTIVALIPLVVLGDFLNRGLFLWGLILFARQPRANDVSWISPPRV